MGYEAGGRSSSGVVVLHPGWRFFIRGGGSSSLKAGSRLTRLMGASPCPPTCLPLARCSFALRIAGLSAILGPGLPLNPGPHLPLGPHYSPVTLTPVGVLELDGPPSRGGLFPCIDIAGVGLSIGQTAPSSWLPTVLWRTLAPTDPWAGATHSPKVKRWVALWRLRCPLRMPTCVT